MARKTSINFVSGVDELNNTLRLLPEKMQRLVINQSLRAGAVHVRRLAQQNVRVRTGDLRDSIVIRKVTSKLKRKGWTGAYVLGFTKPHSRRAHLTEFGTVHSQAYPFIRPAIGAPASIQAIIRKTAINRIKKNAKKLRGPAAKTGLLRRKGIVRRVVSLRR